MILTLQFKHNYVYILFLDQIKQESIHVKNKHMCKKRRKKYVEIISFEFLCLFTNFV